MAADLARAHALLSLAKRDAPDRRRFRRLDMDLTGRLLDRNGEEHDCRTIDISPGDARIASPARAREGDRLIVYLKDIGRVEADIVRVLERSTFAVQFAATSHKRERIAEQLTVLINPAVESDEETRRQRRFNGAGTAPVELEDGTVVPCEILDFSLVGLAVKCARRPLIGEWVKVGNQYGRVSRYLDQGFAIDFENRQQA